MPSTLRRLTLAAPLAILLLLPSLTPAETAVQAWVQRYYGGYGRATAVAVDGSNNVIVTGFSPGSGGNNYTTIKYSSAGVSLWTNRYDGGLVEGSDYAMAVAVDADNSVIVTGYSEAPFYGRYAVYSTVMYSSTGVPLWTNRYVAEGSDYATAVAVDGSNNVIVTGYSWGSGTSYDYATIKYSSAGVPVWTNRYNGPANQYDLATAMAVDRSGNIIVTGYSSGSGGATIKYSSAGIPLWTNLYNGPGDYIEDATAVAVDGSNNVIVMGYSGGFGSSYDYSTIKYSSAGVTLWTNRYNGPGNGNDYPRAVAVDASNNVIVTGSSGAAGSTNYATIKYSSAGVPLWTNCCSGPGSTNDFACAVAVDGSNNVIVTGYSWGSGSSYDYATIKYSGAGVPLWTNRYDGPTNGNDLATAVAVDGSGHVIVTGYSARSGYGYDFATIKYAFPLVITDCKPAAGTFQMLLDNLRPATLVVEASTNLTGWAPVFTNSTPTNMLFYTDPDAGNHHRRFYRAFQFP